jgi:hypothetical protein
MRSHISPEHERALNRKRRHEQPLYQVNVELLDGKIVAVGPSMMEGACTQLAQAIREQIKLGREKRWSNPQVVPIITFNSEN